MPVTRPAETTRAVALILSGLDDEQRAAVLAPPGPLAIVAGAGTGKTRTVTHRLAYRCAVGQLDPRTVLAVTHSAKAAGELRDRVARLGVGDVWARTFHSVALRLLRDHWGATGRDHPLALAGTTYPLVRSAAERVLGRGRRSRTPRAGRPGAEASRDVGEVVFDLTAEIGWAKSQLVTPKGYPAAARRTGRTLALEPEAVAEVFAAYEQEKDRTGRLDFEDLLGLMADLVHGDESVAAAVRRAHTSFVVDEYQDTDPLQERFLEALIGDGDDLTVVGDARQSIYRFKGSDPELLETFAQRHPGAQIVRLVRDYRSTPEVVALANRLIPVPSSEALVGLRPPGPLPQVVQVFDEEAECRHVVRRITRLAASGVSPREIAVLYRFNAHSARFEAALTEAGIPYNVADTERFFDRPEIREPLTAFGRRARRDPGTNGMVLLRTVLAEAGFDEASPPPGAGAARSRWEAQRALLEVLHGVPAVGDQDAAWLLGEVNRRATEAHAPSAGGVTLSTLHKAKGLEYDAVFLVGLVEGSVPSAYAKSDAQLDEERRLLYVGITRAREHLWLSWAQTRPGPRGQTWSAKPSRFLSDIEHRPSGTPGRRPTGRERSRAGGAPAGRRAGSPRRTSTGPSSGATCDRCGGDLKGMAARRLRRCSTDCLDADGALLLARLTAWRTATAAELGIRETALASGRALFTLISQPPTSRFELEDVAGLDRAHASSYAPSLLALFT